MRIQRGIAVPAARLPSRQIAAIYRRLRNQADSPRSFSSRPNRAQGMALRQLHDLDDP